MCIRDRTTDIETANKKKSLKVVVDMSQPVSVQPKNQKMCIRDRNIFFAQLADSANITHFSADATRYFSGEFIFMIFGLPGAALAMYRTAKPEKKKAAGGLLLSAALTCMLTGITEPLEFSFLFVAPVLFAVQVVLAGSAYMIAHILNIEMCIRDRQ